MAPDYSQSKIYKLESLSTGLVYVGSTTQTLSQRLGGHKKSLNQYKKGNLKKYISSIDVLEHQDCKILLLEDYPCQRKEQLLAREAEWIKKMNCVNRQMPGATLAVGLKQYKIQYKIDNKAHLKVCTNLYNKKKYDCACGSSIRNDGRTYHNNSIKHQNYLKTLKKSANSENPHTTPCDKL